MLRVPPKTIGVVTSVAVAVTLVAASAYVDAGYVLSVTNEGNGRKG